MDPAHITRLDQMQAEYDDLLSQLASPDIVSDRQRYTEVSKRVSELDEPIRLYRDYTQAEAEARDARELLRGVADAEELEFYSATITDAQARMEKREARLVELLTPRHPRDDRNVIVEIRKGTGGDEAALFAAELYRMYQRFAERQGWKTEVLDVSESGVGGMNEVVFEVRGKGAFSRLKYESGVHRVQRVPVTESGGRIHTSAATVAVLPEAEEVEVDVAEKDLKIDTFRSSGPGGQHVNTTDSAVRITHVPTGIVVSCQSERSQLQNRDRAMRVLRAKLQERAEAEARAQLASERRSQVGTGDRSEKIRTYNFPQNRVTDHRIGFDVHSLPKFMDGEIEDMLDALARSDGLQQ